MQTEIALGPVAALPIAPSSAVEIPRASQSDAARTKWALMARSGVFGSNGSEALGASDTPKAAAVFNVSVAETATLADTVSAAATFPATVNEAGTLAESTSSTGGDSR
jgi:hypothetical protein